MNQELPFETGTYSPIPGIIDQEGSGDPVRTSQTDGIFNIPVNTITRVDTGIVPLNPHWEYNPPGDSFLIERPGAVFGYNPSSVPLGTTFYIKNVEYNIWDKSPY